LPENLDQRDSEATKKEFKRNAEILGQATGMSYVLSEIPFGVRIDMTAMNPEGKRLLRGGQRFTIQIERLSNGLFVTTTIDLPGPLSMLAMMPVERNSDIEKTSVKSVSQIIGVSEDKCRLI
jgi:hypothetical protein